MNIKLMLMSMMLIGTYSLQAGWFDFGSEAREKARYAKIKSAIKRDRNDEARLRQDKKRLDEKNRLEKSWEKRIQAVWDQLPEPREDKWQWKQLDVAEKMERERVEKERKIAIENFEQVKKDKVLREEQLRKAQKDYDDKLAALEKSQTIEAERQKQEQEGQNKIAKQQALLKKQQEKEKVQGVEKQGLATTMRLFTDEPRSSTQDWHVYIAKTPAMLNDARDALKKNSLFRKYATQRQIKDLQNARAEYVLIASRVLTSLSDRRQLNIVPEDPLQAIHVYRNIFGAISACKKVATEQQKESLDTTKYVFFDQVMKRFENVESFIKLQESCLQAGDMIKGTTFLNEQANMQQRKMMFGRECGVYFQELRLRIAHNFAAKALDLNHAALSQKKQRELITGIRSVLPYIVDEQNSSSTPDMPVKDTVKHKLGVLAESLEKMSEQPAPSQATVRELVQSGLHTGAELASRVVNAIRLV